MQPSLPLVDARHLATSVCGSGGNWFQRHPHDRQHDGQRISLGRRRKRGQLQAIGHSRVGRMIKAHTATAGCGHPVALKIMRPTRCPVSADLIAPLPPSLPCVADTACGSDALQRFLMEGGTRPVTPDTLTRKRIQPFDPAASRVGDAASQDMTNARPISPRLATCRNRHLVDLFKSRARHISGARRFPFLLELL